MYWAQEVANQTEDAELAAEFKQLAEDLTSQESKIVAELAECQGTPAALDGYYHANRETVKKVMRPSASLNSALAK